MADTVAVTKVIEIDVKASASAAQHLKDISNGVKGIENQADKAGNVLKNLLSSVRGFVGFQIFDMVGERVLAFASALQQASDQSKVLEERMKLITSSQAEARTAFQDIIDIAVRQGRELDGVAKLYERVQRNSEQLAISQKGVALITEGVAASLRLSGASTQEANAAMLQFSQALASGKLGGDEFRSLMENNSVLMQAFAKELGLSMGQLREWSKEGKLNAETLRNVMLKFGEDGKNVMQRMIEQAEKLPRTWDQAVTGMKAALIDLMNALQQTTDKTEGFFVKLIRRLTETIREAAQMARDEADVLSEIAKLQSKGMMPADQSVPFETRRLQRISAEIPALEKSLKFAETRLKNAEEEVKWDKVLGQSKVDNAKQEVAAIQGRINAYKQFIQVMRQADDESQRFGNVFVTDKKPTGTTPENDKGKGSKPTTAAEVARKIMEDLQGEGVRLKALMDGESKTRSALEEKLLDIERAAPGGLSKAAIEALKNVAREKSAANEVMMAELEKRKAEAEASAARLEEFNKDVGKTFDTHQKALEKIRGDIAKDRAAEDPLAEAEEEIKWLKKIMWDPATSDADAQMIADRISAVHLKAVRKLMGEKDPLPTVGEILSKSWENAFDRMEDDLLDFSKSTKEIMKDLITSLLMDFARLQLRENLNPLLQMGSDYIKKFDWSSLFASADGSAFENGVRKFAKGGILDGPTMFSYNGGQVGMGGEAGTEAVMPLKRGTDGKLGVEATPVTVIINNNAPNTRTRQTQTTDSNGEQQIHVIIEEAVESSLGSGRFDRVLNNSYALTRKGR